MARLFLTDGVPKGTNRLERLRRLVKGADAPFERGAQGRLGDVDARVQARVEGPLPRLARVIDA